MAQSLTLISTGRLRADMFERVLPSAWRNIVRGAREEKCVHWASNDESYELGYGHVEISRVSEPLEAALEYVEWDNCPQNLARVLDRCEFWSVRFNNYNMARVLVQHLLSYAAEQPGQAWVDNDYGVLIEAEPFLRALEKQPRWDWRSEDLGALK